MKKRTIIYILLLLSTALMAKESYVVYDRENPNDFNSTYVKIDGFKEIKLLVGVGTPYVRSLESLSDRIKLLHCSGGAMGTRVLVNYYYTYILDFKTKKVMGLLEYYDDEGAYTKTDKTPLWSLKENRVEVLYINDDDERVKQVYEIVE